MTCIVVGAGPAGTATALALARGGVDVTIVERTHFPRRKVCGEYLNAGAVALIDALGLGDSLRAIARPLHGLLVSAVGAAPVRLALRGASLAAPREALDAMLLEAARAGGASVVWGRVEALLRGADGRVNGVRYRDDRGDDHELLARFVVGADGVGSLVAKKLGLTLAPARNAKFALGGHYDGFGAGSDVEMFVGGGAYFALNPLGEGRANVMVVVRKSALERWSGAIDVGMSGAALTLAGGTRSIEGMQRVGDRVSVGPLAHRTSRRTAPGVVLVGDAGGFLNPFTGQGVYLALKTAALAGSTILSACAEPARERALFAQYDRDVRRDFAARRRLTQLVDLMVDVPVLARRAAVRLARRPHVARAMLDALSGGSPRSVLQPATLGQLLL